MRFNNDVKFLKAKFMLTYCNFRLSLHRQFKANQNQKIFLVYESLNFPTQHL